MDIGPLFVLVVAGIAKETIPRAQWLIAIATMIACIVLIVAVLSGNSAIQLEINNACYHSLICQY
ncbi:MULTISPECIES: hypothetical protein [unclassified Lysinibacillus]|uniref:hypothetical protein n=1 Tax=unclassified Lysinibacillus TaxID=2636778 RepID=UPI00382491DD